MAAFSEWSCQLDTENVIAGRSADVRLTNLGNIRQICNIALEFDRSQLDFLPVQAEDVRIQPGETVTVKFAARVRHKRWFGGESEYPFRVHVRATEHKYSDHQPVWFSVVPEFRLLSLDGCLQRPGASGTGLAR